MEFLIVLNAGLSSEDFFDKDNFLLNCANELDINLTLKTNTDIKYYYSSDGIKVDLPNYDAVLFYSKDIFLAKALEKNGYKVFNSSECIKNCDNKILTYKILAENKLPIPKTFVLPLTFFYNKELLSNFLDMIESELLYPMVAKKWFGSEGKQVFLIKSRNELDTLIRNEHGKELLFQEFFSECSGVDYRLNIVNNKVISAMKRSSLTGDFRSNTSLGGKAENYNPTTEEIELSLKASKVLDCSFSGIDIMHTKKGLIICEVNSNAQLKNILSLSKINAFKLILEYIKNEISK
ncbi:MAG: RimK family alpha-L-glutamate ligase [Clostridia bacterium]|nr:RimK family alpha-L-glutamate ligase [Clostridia bacterium]